MAKKEIVPTTKKGIFQALAAALDAAGDVKSEKKVAAVYERLLDLAVKGANQEEKGSLLPGLGKVKIVKRGARMVRNPQTQQMVKCKAKKVAKIVACKALKDALVG